MGTWTRVALLVVVVAAATLVGSLGGGALGKAMSAARGGVGDDLVFAGLIWGALGSLVLSFVVGIVAARPLRLAWWVGALVAAACMVLLVSLFVGPWHVF